MPHSFLPMLVVASVMMACLGMGNGAVFQLVLQRFRKEIGVATGVIGAAGGFGGFALTNLVLGPLKQRAGKHVASFLAVALLVLAVLGIFSLAWGGLDAQARRRPRPGSSPVGESRN